MGEQSHVSGLSCSELVWNSAEKQSIVVPIQSVYLFFSERPMLTELNQLSLYLN